jgi:hypothetical protein
MQTAVVALIILISAVFLCCAAVDYAIFRYYLEGLTNLQNKVNNLEQQAEGIFPSNQTPTPAITPITAITPTP